MFGGGLVSITTPAGITSSTLFDRGDDEPVRVGLEQVAGDRDLVTDDRGRDRHLLRAARHDDA